jgi:hypothetical protein
VRRLALTLLLACACAHAPPAEPEAETAPVEKHTVELSDDVTPPVRKSCRGRGPRLGDRDRIAGTIAVDYLVGADGKVSDVNVSGDANAGGARAVRRFLEGCRYTPAMRAGKPVEIRWRGELTFPAR